MNIVLDTNILVSAVWSPGCNATKILEAVFCRKFTVCYDYRILEEYDRVLHYPKLKFSETAIEAVLGPLIKNGISVNPDPIKDVSFERDETDREFYEAARFCKAVLVSDNPVHYPREDNILLSSEFIERYM